VTIIAMAGSGRSRFGALTFVQIREIVPTCRFFYILADLKPRTPLERIHRTRRSHIRRKVESGTRKVSFSFFLEKERAMEPKTIAFLFSDVE